MSLTDRLRIECKMVLSAISVQYSTSNTTAYTHLDEYILDKPLLLLYCPVFLFSGSL